MINAAPALEGRGKTPKNTEFFPRKSAYFRVREKQELFKEWVNLSMEEERQERAAQQKHADRSQ